MEADKWGSEDGLRPDAEEDTPGGTSGRAFLSEVCQKAFCWHFSFQNSLMQAVAKRRESPSHLSSLWPGGGAEGWDQRVLQTPWLQELAGTLGQGCVCRQGRAASGGWANGR